MKKIQQQVQEVFRRFDELTRDTRSGLPIHIPFTKYKGYNLLDITMLKFGVDREKAKQIIQSFLYVTPARGGVLVFLEKPEKSKKEKSNPKDILKDFE